MNEEKDLLDTTPRELYNRFLQAEKDYEILQKYWEKTAETNTQLVCELDKSQDEANRLATENDKLRQQLANALERERNARDDAKAAEAECDEIRARERKKDDKIEILFARIHQHRDRIHKLYKSWQKTKN